MINNNNNKEGQMAHKVQTRTFTFGKYTFTKGVNSYDYNTAYGVIIKAIKVQLSYVDKNGFVQFETVGADIAVQNLKKSNRMLVNKLGSALGCIIYLGAQ